MNQLSPYAAFFMRLAVGGVFPYPAAREAGVAVRTVYAAFGGKKPCSAARQHATLAAERQDE